MQNRIVLLICLLTMALSLCIISPSKANTKLLAHWTFDQVENNVIKDVVGNNDGAIIGNWKESDLRPGLNGKAFYFGNYGRYNHRVKLESTKDISLIDDFTVECVIKPEDITGFRTIMWKGDRHNEPEIINYYFDIRDGKPEMKFKDDKGRWTVYSTSQAVLKSGNWYHLIFTKQKGDVDIYVNGEKFSVKKSEDGKAVNLLPNEYNAFIGAGAAAKNVTKYLFEGLIDDIKIYQGVDVDIPHDYNEKWQLLVSKNIEQTGRFEARQEAIKAEEQKEMLQEYTAFFKQQAAGEKIASFTVCVLSSAKRLVKEPGFFKKLEAVSKTARISAAGNEYEGFNIIVLGNPSTKTEISKVSISDLVNMRDESRISSNNITYGYVKDVVTANPDIPVDFVGAIPDVIMNGVRSFEVENNSFTPVFVKVYTGDAKPGDYKGTITLEGNGHKEKIDINLQVYDFTLPARGSLRTAFSFFESFYKEWYDIKEISDQQRDYIYRFLLDYRLSPNNIYAGSPGSIHPNLDNVNKIKDQTNFFSIKGYGNTKPVSEKTIEKQVKSIGDSIEKVKQAGLLDDMYYYSYDELTLHSTPEKLAAVKQLQSALMEAYPNLRLMQTSPPEKHIDGLFNVWVPLFSYFDSKEALETLGRLKKQGDEVWWYPADSPQSPYPNFFLDYSVFNNRIISTLSYMYDIDGLLYWCINREWLTNMDIRKEWPDAEWKPYTNHIHTGVRKYKHGMGNFIYPGPSGKLLPSLRLENLRDGLEDYEYLKELGRSIKKLKSAGRKDEDTLLKEAIGLLEVPAPVATSVSKWSSDPDHLLKYRNHVGEVISKIHAEIEQ